MFSSELMYLQQETKKPMGERDAGEDGKWLMGQQKGRMESPVEGRTQGKEGGRVEAEGERCCCQGGSWTRVSFLLAFLPSSSCAPLSPLAHSPAPSCREPAASRPDLPRTRSGLTAAWSCWTSELRVMSITRRKKPPNFMLPSEVFSENAARLRTAAIYALAPLS